MRKNPISIDRDFFYNDKVLERVNNAFKRHPKTKVITGDAVYSDREGNPTYTTETETYMKEVEVERLETIHSTDGKVVAITPATAISANPTIRFAWKDNPEKHNMKGKNGLPASPFQLDVK